LDAVLGSQFPAAFEDGRGTQQTVSHWSPRQHVLVEAPAPHTSPVARQPASLSPPELLLADDPLLALPIVTELEPPLLPIVPDELLVEGSPLLLAALKELLPSELLNELPLLVASLDERLLEADELLAAVLEVPLELVWLVELLDPPTPASGATHRPSAQLWPPGHSLLELQRV
jgi:hypothetical protein